MSARTSPARRRRVGIALSICGLMLACAAGSAAAAVVPAEGPWHGTTSAGLPVTFEVAAGQIVDPRFGFKWGFCGAFNSEPGLLPVAMGPEGHWKVQDARGPYVEASFVTAGRAEGAVLAPGRMTPGCPGTRATFVAEPGYVPYPEPESVVPIRVGKSPLEHEPTHISLRRDGSLRLYDLDWVGFGEESATATGRAYMRSGRVVLRPRVTVTLLELVEEAKFSVYEEVEYVIHGRVPPGFHRKGSVFL